MENKNVLIAIVLSAAILIAWTVFVQGPQLEKQQAAQQAQLEGQQAQQPQLPAGQPAQQDASRTVVSREEALAQSARVSIDNPRIKGSINLKGARLDDLVLKDYRETVKPTSPNIVLLSPRESEHGYYADIGWFSEAKDIKLPDKDTVWQADGTALEPGQPVTLSWDNGQGLTFARKFEVDADYMFTVTDTVTNASGQPVELAPYGRVVRYGTPKDASEFYVLHEGPIGVFDETLQEHSYGSTRDEAEDGAKFTYTSTGGWMGISDKYWLVSQIPPQEEALTGNMFYDPKS
ncbi:MAG TPA: membrane protein insertase YidC, partial [Dongiaceae bacterium]|nr:membrane protein insertase YidC [Dongiaceae bacterium]